MHSSSPPPNEERERTSQFVPLFSANSRRIYTYILTLVPNRADAEEVFQEVSSILWERFGDFTLGTHFGAWACRIAYYKVLQFQDRRRLHPLAFSDAMFTSLDEEMLRMDDTLDQEYHALANCMAKLREKDRDLITMRYSDGGTPQRIANEVGRPIKSIYKSLDRIRHALLECVQRALATGENG